MKKYIDCDGVIIDTEAGLFDEYYQKKEYNPELEKRLYLQQLDWVYWIHQAMVINNAIEILREYDPFETDILTKVHSLQEALAKIEYFRENKVRNNIIIVPDGTNKSNIVTANGNILVDDSNNNLDDWKNNEGFSIYFGTSLSAHPTIDSLDEILNPTKLQKTLQKINFHQ